MKLDHSCEVQGKIWLSQGMNGKLNFLLLSLTEILYFYSEYPVIRTLLSSRYTRIHEHTSLAMWYSLSPYANQETPMTKIGPNLTTVTN